MNIREGQVWAGFWVGAGTLPEINQGVHTDPLILPVGEGGIEPATPCL
jgi:hypothetical protein